MEQTKLSRFCKKYMDILAPNIQTNLRESKFDNTVYTFIHGDSLIFNLIQTPKRNTLVVHPFLHTELENIFGDLDFIEDFLKVWFKDTYRIRIDIISFV